MSVERDHAFDDTEYYRSGGIRLNLLINEFVKKVILPNSSLKVFAAELEPREKETEIENVRKQLTPITLKVDYRDIYENKFTLERSLEWFSRHMSEAKAVPKQVTYIYCSPYNSIN